LCDNRIETQEKIHHNNDGDNPVRRRLPARGSLGLHQGLRDHGESFCSKVYDYGGSSPSDNAVCFSSKYDIPSTCTTTGGRGGAPQKRLVVVVVVVVAQEGTNRRGYCRIGPTGKCGQDVMVGNFYGSQAHAATLHGGVVP
jgi:hypothetical protein